MPTYEELMRLLRNLVKATHMTLGQEDLHLTRETGALMVALQEAQDALVPTQQPTQSAPQQPAEDYTVIEL